MSRFKTFSSAIGLALAVSGCGTLMPGMSHLAMEDDPFAVPYDDESAGVVRIAANGVAPHNDPPLQTAFAADATEARYPEESYADAEEAEPLIQDTTPDALPPAGDQETVKNESEKELRAARIHERLRSEVAEVLNREVAQADGGTAASETSPNAAADAFESDPFAAPEGEEISVNRAATETAEPKRVWKPTRRRLSASTAPLAN